ncbi:MAG: FGGY family carbohydrate kinase [Candidatus Cryptobacteroides sp.]|nr:FGGY family carbohydrate kinase [Bacteroidales bacterium]MDY6158688.1 FGGY family carbohydrate kinase [Candidatus Cryptobacteroides sp.]
MYSLGIDVGSSSVKVALLDIESGKCVCSSTNPKVEAPIIAERKGWAEQDPQSWWNYLCEGVKDMARDHDMSQVAAIGISYQMHGLVAIDKDCKPVRNSIIWCDSRAVEIGAAALEGIGYEKCMSSLLNSPGNFTASKLAWVKKNEPQVYERIRKFMLPGDYIAYLLTGEVTTTATGLSEGILWDFKNNSRADFVAEYYGIEKDKFSDIVPAVGIQARTSRQVEELLGIPEGTPVSYRAGDQPNNAFSLNVLRPGEIAATGGTSGVVYGVTDLPKADPQSRVNTFLHVTGSDEPRMGVLLCINGTGIMNSWAHKNVAFDMSYPEMNELAATAPVGSDGLLVLPFGNGAERVLANRNVGAKLAGIDLVRHSRAHILRAVQEGIAFSFRYGIDIMKDLGLRPNVIRAGKANMFLSPLFRSTLATLCDARIELFDTDGSLGAARGAALGAGIYKNADEAFATLGRLDVIEPAASWKDALEEAYANWKAEVEKSIAEK